MNINAISSQTFGARFATLDECEYTPKQKSLVQAVEQDLRNPNCYNITKIKFDKINDNCFIIAKPSGKNGIFFQACAQNYDFENEREVWYDEVLPCSTLITEPVHTKKDILRTFVEVVDKLQNLDDEILLSDWDWYRMDVRDQMENPPQNINIIV